MQLARERLGEVAPPERAQLGRLGVLIDQLQQHAAHHVGAQRVELGAHHRQAERRAHQRIEPRQRLLDDRQRRLLQARGLDEARHLGVLDQREIVLDGVRGQFGPAARALQGCAKGLVEPACERRAQAPAVLEQPGARVGQLHARGHRARAPLGLFQRHQRGLGAAVDHGRGHEHRFLPGALDQGAVGADRLHRVQETVARPDLSVRIVTTIDYIACTRAFPRNAWSKRQLCRLCPPEFERGGAGATALRAGLRHGSICYIIYSCSRLFHADMKPL